MDAADFDSLIDILLRDSREDGFCAKLFKLTALLEARNTGYTAKTAAYDFIGTINRESRKVGEEPLTDMQEQTVIALFEDICAKHKPVNQTETPAGNSQDSKT